MGRKVVQGGCWSLLILWYPVIALSSYIWKSQRFSVLARHFPIFPVSFFKTTLNLSSDYAKVVIPNNGCTISHSYQKYTRVQFPHTLANVWFGQIFKKIL
jgi:hypothetical protein